MTAMDYRTEATYLVELQQLAGAMILYAESVEQARDQWIDSHRAWVELSRLHPREQANRQNEESPAYLHALQESQREIWMAMEGLLSVWARASLLLFPSRKASEARGSHLRGILGIPNDHLLSDRTLRNHWMHYDERLDDALAEHGAVTPQRFIAQGETVTGTVMRLVILPSLHIDFAGTDVNDLRAMIAAARDLSWRVEQAIGTAGDRHRDEFLARAQDDLSY